MSSPQKNSADSIARRPLYVQVRDRIRESLKRHQPGDRLGTEGEFVRRFNVSLVTVRRALSELEKEGVIERRQGSGTYVAEVSSAGKHVAVLLDVDIASGPLSPAYFKIVKEVRSSLKSMGIPCRPYLGNLPLGVEPTGITCEDLLEDVRLDRVRGLIGFFIKRDPAWTDLFEQKGVPIVDAHLFRKEDFQQKMAMMEQVLVYFHHRRRSRIAILGWESLRDGVRPFREAFSQLAPKYGIEMDSRLLDLSANGWEQGMGWERFRDIWTSSKDRPDGLFVADDSLFADCQRAITELNIPVPKVLDVVVRSSDAIELNPRFPIYVLKLMTNSYAKVYTLAMKALMEGASLPSLQLAPFVGAMEGDFPEVQTSLFTESSTIKI